MENDTPNDGFVARNFRMIPSAVASDRTIVTAKITGPGKRFRVIPEIKPFRFGIARGSTPNKAGEFGSRVAEAVRVTTRTKEATIFQPTVAMDSKPTRPVPATRPEKNALLVYPNNRNAARGRVF